MLMTWKCLPLPLKVRNNSTCQLHICEFYFIDIQGIYLQKLFNCLKFMSLCPFLSEALATGKWCRFICEILQFFKILPEEKCEHMFCGADQPQFCLDAKTLKGNDKIRMMPIFHKILSIDCFIVFLFQKHLSIPIGAKFFVRFCNSSKYFQRRNVKLCFAE